MHDYTISIGREHNSELFTYPFSFRTHVNQPLSEFWAALLAEFRDYESGFMWPTQYSQPSIDSFPPKAGGFLELTYQMPDPRDPDKPKMDLTYDFEILAYREGESECYLDYGSGRRHPFLGGGRISVQEDTPRRTELEWAGSYKFLRSKMHREEAGQIFSYYFAMFFNGFAENLKQRGLYD